MVDMEIKRNELRDRLKAVIRARAISNMLIDDFIRDWERLEGVSLMDSPACEAINDPLDRVFRFVQCWGMEDEEEETFAPDESLNQSIELFLQDLRELCGSWSNAVH